MGINAVHRWPAGTQTVKTMYDALGGQRLWTVVSQDRIPVLPSVVERRALTFLIRADMISVLCKRRMEITVQLIETGHGSPLGTRTEILSSESISKTEGGFI